MENLLIILVALCITNFAHNAMEIWGVRQKVQWLKMSMQGLEHGHWPIDVNSKAKTAALHAVIFIAATGTVFLFLKFLSVSERSLLGLGISVSVASYLYTTWQIDKYHTRIENLIAKAQKPDK